MDSRELAELLLPAVRGPHRPLTAKHFDPLRLRARRKPYHRHLIFYRLDDKTLWAERVLHGARDLPRRLRQSNYEGE